MHLPVLMVADNSKNHVACLAFALPCLLRASERPQPDLASSLARSPGSITTAASHLALPSGLVKLWIGFPSGTGDRTSTQH